MPNLVVKLNSEHLCESDVLGCCESAPRAVRDTHPEGLYYDPNFIDHDSDMQSRGDARNLAF